MQCGSGVGAQPDDVAGVGRNFGIDQDDMKHGDYPMDLWKQVGGYSYLSKNQPKQALKPALSGQSSAYRR